MSYDKSSDLNNVGKYVQDIADIRQSWYIILNTIKGSAPLRPEFGSSLFEYIDKPINQLGGNFVSMIISDLEQWEKRATITKVTVNKNPLSITVYGIFTASQEPITSTITL